MVPVVVGPSSSSTTTSIPIGPTEDSTSINPDDVSTNVQGGYQDEAVSADKVTGIGEIQAMNAFAADLISHEEDFEHAASVFHLILSEISQGAIRPTHAPSDKSGSLQSPASEAGHHNSSEVDMYFLDTDNSFDAAHEDPEGKEEFATFCFVRHPCMFECTSCNAWHSNRAKQLRKQQQLQGPNMIDSAPEPKPVCCSGATVSPQKHCAVAMSCLYNLALCYQLQWNQLRYQHQQGRPSESDEIAYNEDETLEYLVKALDLYKQAINVALHAACTAGVNMLTLFPASDPIWDVIMAICANAAHCAIELAQLPEIHVWSRRLRQALHNTQQHYKESQQRSSEQMRREQPIAPANQQKENQNSPPSQETAPSLPHYANVSDEDEDLGDDTDDDDMSVGSSNCYQRHQAKEYRSFLWQCVFRHKVSGVGAPMA